MKWRPKFGVVAAVLVFLIIGALDYMSAIKAYDERKEEANSLIFEGQVMNFKDERFLKHVQDSWVALRVDNPETPLMDFCEMIEFDSTVAGLVGALTHEVPLFSAWNFEQNFKEVRRAGGRIGLDIEALSIDGKIYYKEGVAFMKVHENLIDYYEDTEDGVRNVVYGKLDYPVNE